MDNIGKRIKEIRAGRGLTQKEFARIISISQGYLTNVERGKNQPSSLVLAAIQNKFNVRMEWLKAGKGQKEGLDFDYVLGLIEHLPKEEKDKVEQMLYKSIIYDAIPDEVRARLLLTSRPVPDLKVVSRRELGGLERWSPYVAVPLLAEEVAAGMPRVIEEETIEDFCLVYESWAKRPQDYICVRVKGDSMEPVLPDGSIVAVHLKSLSPKRLMGKLVVARHEGGVVVKELAQAGDHWVLLSYNKEHGPIVLDPLGEESPIIGKVAWWWARQE
jgi:SOS-response transcriptional repressor LexA/DNA-binding XRE family transcriptional regulator